MCTAQRRKDNQKKDERFTHESKPSQSLECKPHEGSHKKEIYPINKEEKRWSKKPKKTLPDSPLEDEDLEDAAQLPRTLDDSEDSDYKPQEDFDVHEVATARRPRRSNRTIRKPEKYCHSETLTIDDDTEDSELGSPRKRLTGTANYQATTTTQDGSKVLEVEEHPADPAQLIYERDQETTSLQPSPAQQSGEIVRFRHSNRPMKRERELDPHEL